MSFGTGTGPPATEKQIGYLESLLRKAGHTSWSDARRALGLTAKQGRGKFTKAEASALIDQLTGADDTPSTGTAEEPVRATDEAPRDRMLAGVADGVLADELRRRGWQVTRPSTG